MKQIIYTLIILFSLTLNIRAQKEFGHVTPTTADFIRYGEVPVSLFTGKLNYEVPIYHIKDRDFDIPISLTYTSDGFKPAKRSGLVGLDWFLNVGGVISREVYGSPDETVPNATLGQELGYLMTVQRGKYDKDKVWNFDPDVILTDQSLAYKYLKPISSYFCDYNPDLFLFSFNGHNGHFMIDNQGVPKTNIKGYDVDISGLAPQYRYDLVLPDPSTIKIYTPDGYEYIFGGDLSALEFSMSFMEGELPVAGTTAPTILAWHLSQIIAPNGRSVKFNYKTTILDNSLSKTDPIWTSSRRAKTGTHVIPEWKNYNYTAVKAAILESIEVDDIKIAFNKSVEETLKNIYTVDQFFRGYADFNHASYQLDSINITKTNSPLFTYKLGYTNNYKRRFLSSFTQPDGGVYNFTYNHPDTGYPQPDVSGETDTWGYWKISYPTFPHRDTLTIAPMNIAKQGPSMGPYSLLNMVTYPTGGYSKFAYNHNQSTSRIDQKLTNGLIAKQLVTDTIELGGFSIYEIDHYSSTNKIETQKRYFYTENLSSPSPSSGIIYQYPPYYLDQFYRKIFIGDWIENYNISEPVIGYTKVYEQNMDGSYTKYTFTDYHTNPDVNNSKISWSSTDFDPQLLASTSVNRSTSNSQKRGLLSSKQLFDSKGNSISTEEYIYKNLPSRQISTNSNVDIQPSDYIVSFRSITGGAMATKLYLQSSPIISKTNTTNGVTKKTLYNYDTNDLLSCQKEIDSHSDTIKTVYNYLQNFKPVNTNSRNLLLRNYLNYPTEKIQYKNAQYLSSQAYSYKKSTPYPLVDSVKTFIGSNRSNPNFTKYEVYDAYGNPVSVIKNGADKIVYLWGYNGQYPIAKIENATYENVKNALGGTLPESLSSNASFDASVITKLRSDNTNLSNAQITTYTYQPLAGILTETDPRGITTYYNYDTNNRLKETYIMIDGAKKVVQKYDYHYKGK